MAIKKREVSKYFCEFFVQNSTADKWFLTEESSIREVAQEGFPGISASSIYKELHQLPFFTNIRFTKNIHSGIEFPM